MKKVDTKSSVRLDFIHLCETAILDITQKLSLIGMFENFNFREFPSLFPKFTVIASLRFEVAESHDYPARVVILNPDGTECAHADFMLKNQGRGLSVLTANFVNREFRMPGLYSIEIWVGDHKIGQKPFTVTLVEQAKNR